MMNRRGLFGAVLEDGEGGLVQQTVHGGMHIRQPFVEQVLNPDDHRWFPGKMDPEEAARQCDKEVR